MTPDEHRARRGGPLDVPAGAACPEAEVLAAFVDGALRAGDRHDVALHLAACADCREIVAETVRFQETEMPGGRRPSSGSLSRWMIAGGALAAAAAVLLAVWAAQPAWLARWRGQGSARPQLAQLVAAVGDHRPIEARLSGGFAYGPPPSPMRGATAPEVDPDIRIAAAEIEKQNRAHETPLSEDALGVAYLVSGDLDRSVPLLEDAVDQQPGNGDFQNDLAAAYLAEAKRVDRAEDYPKALAAAERAIKADPSLTEAWFNRALALEALYLTGEARKAWTDYLQRDSTSKWADEARKHLAILPDPLSGRTGKPTVRGSAQLYEQLLPGWGAAVLRGSVPESRRYFREADALAQKLTSATGDRMPVDSVKTARLAKGRNRELLAQGLLTYRAGRRLFTQDRVHDAALQFQKASEQLDAADDPIAGLARYYQSFDSYDKGDLGKTIEVLEKVAQRSRERSYVELRALAECRLGVALLARSDPESSLAKYEDALAAFQQIGSPSELGYVHGLIAENLFYLGSWHQSWNEQLTSLRFAASADDFRERHSILALSNLMALKEQWPEVALDFEDEAIANDRAWRQAGALAATYLQRAKSLVLLEHPVEADDDLTRAAALLPRIPDAAFRDQFEAELLFAQAQVWQRAMSSVSVDLSTMLKARFERSGSVRLPELLLNRAQARQRRGDYLDAEKDLRSGIALLQRRSIGDPAGLSAFSDDWALYDELVRLDLDVKHCATCALVTAEAARALRLRDTHGAAFDAVAMSELRDRMPKKSMFLEYMVLPDRLVVWKITASGTSMVQEPISSEALSRVVRRYLAAVNNDRPDVATQLAERLYSVLIAPAFDGEDPPARLIIVPDAIVARVPFAALKNGRSGRFLVEETAVSFAPNLAGFDKPAARHSAAMSDTRALVVGVGHGRSVVQAGLPALPGAPAEARAVAAVYPNSDLLLDDSATPDAFVSNARVANVIHFAGHAVVDEEYPWLSRLLLGGTASQVPDAVFAGDIKAGELPNARLVVLSACDTDSGIPRRGQGVMGLARAFLAAGVPDVVATLWPQSDRASAVLFEQFHRAFRETHDAVDALRTTQISLLKSDDAVLQKVSSWGGAVAISTVWERQ